MSPFGSPRRRNRSLARQVCLAIVLAAGLNLVWGLGFAWAISIVSQLTRTKEPYAQINVTADGIPLREIRSGDGRAPEYTTLDGKPYAVTDKARWLQGAPLSIESPQDRWSVTKPVEPRIEGFSDGRRTPVDWFFVQFRKPQSVGYFVGYDRVSQQRVGYIGRNGFQIEEPNVEQVFPIRRIREDSWATSGLIAPEGVTRGNTPAQFSLSYPFGAADPSPNQPASSAARTVPPAIRYLISGDQIDRIDLRARTVKTVLAAPGLSQIGIITRLREPAAGKAVPSDAATDSRTPLDEALVVRARGSVIVLDSSGREETIFHLPAELANRSFNFLEMPDRTGFAMVYRTDLKNWTNDRDLVWFTQEGKITRRVNGVLAGPIWQMSLQEAGCLVALAVPTPLGPIGRLLYFPLEILEANDDSGPLTYAEAVMKEFPSIIPSIVLSLVFVVIALWLYFRRTARYGEERRAAWVVLIALWGLPAYFGYVWQRHWPPRLACDSCGEPAPRDREECFHCGEEFARPALNGLEIFA
jgi:hypothetical protein